MCRSLQMHITLTSGLSTICSIINSTNDHPRSGRPRVTTPRQDRFILHHHLQERFTTTTEMARYITGTQQRPISANTVRCRRRPARGPILTNRHRQERMQWATAHQQLRYQQWRRVLCISSADGRVWVWRGKCERYAGACVMVRDT